MTIRKLINIIIFWLFALSASASVSPHCQLADDFDKKFILELDGESLLKKYLESASNLGEGAFGQVKEISWKDSVKGPISVAVKRIILNSQTEEKNFATEIENLALFAGNPYVMQVFGCMETKSWVVGALGATQVTAVYVVTERLFGDYSTLRVTAKLSSKSSIERKKIYLEVAKALKTIHDQNVMHNDIKPQNFMAVDSSLSTIKLIDFGLSGKRNQKLSGGTLVYAAPDYFQKGSMKPEVDIYAWAVSIAHLEFGFPQITQDVAKLKNINKNYEIPGQVTSNIRKLIQNSPLFKVHGPSKDSLGKIISDCLNTSYTDRPDDAKLIARLTAVIDDERRFLMKSTNIDKGISDKFAHSSSAADATRVRNNRLEHEKLDSGISTIYLNVVTGLLAIGFGLPIVYCLRRQHSQ